MAFNIAIYDVITCRFILDSQNILYLMQIDKLQLIMGIIKRVLLLLICSSFLNACVKPPKSIADDDSKEYFDFKTIGNYNLNINYNLKSETPVEFYVYDEYPFKAAGSEYEGETFREDLSPVLKGFTDIKGKYSGIITIKNAVKQLYLFSPTIGVPQVLKSSFTANAFSLDTSNPLNYMESGISAPFISTKGLSGLAQDAIIAEGYHSLGTWTLSGVPSYLISPNAILPAAMINDLNSSLPENKKVPDLNPHFIVNENTRSFSIESNAKVELVFIHEGASMKNVLGYFHFPTGNPPRSASEITKIIAFPNVSYAGSGGNLSTGNRVQLKYWDGSNYQETFPAGVSIGWFIIAFGFNSEGKILTKNPHYYSFSEFNPETDANLKAHCVVIFDSARKVYVIGFEDQLRTKSDNDFNDALFYVNVTPEGSVQSSIFPQLKKSSDSDGDGIPDDRDEFPNDAKTAYTNYYPSYNGYNTLAFEDLWPNRGDYDMNDVVVSYNSAHYMNSSNRVVKTIDKIRPIWSGGILDVGFGYQLGVASTAIKSVGKSSDFKDNSFKYSLSSNGTENQQSKATILVFDNITELGLNGAVKPYFNMEVTFNSPVSVSDLTTPPYNPFIIINKNRGMEVHMPNYRPTDRADFKLFGTYNDKSQPSLSRFYVSDAEMPWGILIPGEFKYPAERLSIVNYYPNFLQWAKSFGAEFPDWYLYPSNK